MTDLTTYGAIESRDRTTRDYRPVQLPYVLLSLYDMLIWLAGDFYDALTQLHRFERQLLLDPAVPWPENLKQDIEIVLGILDVKCRELNIQAAYDQIIRAKIRLRDLTELDPIKGHAGMAERFCTLRQLIEDELRVRRFLYIPREKVKYWEDGGSQVFGNGYRKFAVARIDMNSACHCFVTEEYTASAYHSMRVAEFGLRWLAVQLNVKITDKKTDIPLEYGEWKKVVDAINQKIEEAHKLPNNAEREAELQFYSDAADSCSYMKEIRNEISHARKTYNEPEALGLLNRVIEFMKRLATRAQ